MKIFFAVCVIALTLVSCEKDIDFKTNQTNDVLVVDGIIEDGKAPQIILTKSLNYFSAINANIVANSFVHNAIITINDGNITSKLKEVEVPLGIGYSLYYYTNDAATPATNIYGVQGKKYDLKIISNGAEYTSTTTIPFLTKKCDSLWWKPVPNNPDTSLALLMGKFTDPPGLGNYIRYFTQINDGAFLPGEKSAFEDQVIDGTTYSIQIEQGIDRNNPVEDKDKGYFHRGDTVTLKFCNTDKATYTFWNTWEFAIQSIGNPFSTPNKVLGNISNGALGVFSGYSVDYKKLIIPKQ
ncbi:MAG: DUF4249 domain-containing protein [Chitinophagaceae bacterium]